jgi:inhibitor of cysteine peptidase
MVSLAPGEILVLELHSNPTTGYSWQILEVDDLLLRSTGEPEYRPDSNAQELVGSGGTEVFRFEAVASGETTLALGYARPWEKSEQPLETFTVRVLIQ